jgi:poly-gamma-glutamate capsule biosynthesis protein CapA/YwtB (metallophosphatase superfamily)
MSLRYYLGTVIAVSIIAAFFTFPFKYSFNSFSFLPKQNDAAAGSLTGAAQKIALTAEEDPAEPTLIFVGDIMLGRKVEDLLKTNGDDYPFTNLDPFLKSADTVVANLEGPVMAHHIQTPSGSVRFAFDTRIPELLMKHNIKIVTLANNHTFDFGSDGYFQTTAYLDNAGVLHTGHPFAFSDDYVLRTTIEGKKFIMVGFNFTNPNFNVAQASAFVKSLDRGPDEFLIAMIHGGDEYKLHSNEKQQAFYRGLIDDGADLVIAHHPHVVEEVETYKNKLIFYSLGNFIFDQYFSHDVQEELSMRVSFKKTGIEFELVPLQSLTSQPILMAGEAKRSFLKKLADRSSLSLSNSIQAGLITLPITHH